MAGFGEWLLTKSLNGAARIAAACGDAECRRLVEQLDKTRSEYKTEEMIHKYAEENSLTHEEAANQLGIKLPSGAEEEFNEYDPIRWPGDE